MSKKKKPTTSDGINYCIRGCKFKVLDIDDIIKKNDLMRELLESGEEGGFNTTYRLYGWVGLFWHKISDDLSGWVGKTYREYIAFGNKDYNEADYLENDIHFMSHEIIRIIK